MIIKNENFELECVHRNLIFKPDVLTLLAQLAFVAESGHYLPATPPLPPFYKMETKAHPIVVLS